MPSSSKLPEKKKVVDALVLKLQGELDAIEKAARAAHEAATHEESKAEDQHDTRGLEASYLAGAQAQRAQDISQQITIYRMMPLKGFGEKDAIAPGALFELEADEESGGRSGIYWLAPRGGGGLVQVDGVSVTVLTPQSPMGDAVLGRNLGDWIEVESKGVTREYRLAQLS
jgi:hypothetical protein